MLGGGRHSKTNYVAAKVRFEAPVLKFRGGYDLESSKQQIVKKLRTGGVWFDYCNYP